MYDQPMTVDHPGCVLFLIDQTGSMAAGWGRHTAAEFVADAVNRLLSGLVARCREGGKVRDLLYVGAIGYGGPLHEDLLGHRWRGCQPISRLPEGRPGVLVPGPADGHGRLVKRRPWPLRVWLEPLADYGSERMPQTLTRATVICREFLDRHPDSYPPIVINLTDAHFTDGDPDREAAHLRQVSGRQGTVLLVNIHVLDGGEPVEFPATPPPDPFGALLFEMSSVLPEQMRAAAARMRRPLVPGARGFAYNARADSLARLLDTGLPAALLPARRRG